MKTILLNALPKFSLSQPTKAEPPLYNAPKLQTLQKDTVSFTGRKRDRSRIDNPKPSEPSGFQELPRLSKRVVASSRQTMQDEFKPICERLFSDYQEGKDWFVRLKDDEKVANKVVRRTSGLEEEDLKKIDTKKVKEITTDLAGGKVITDGSDKATNEIVQRILDEVNSGRLTVTEIRNYHGVWKAKSKSGEYPAVLSLDPISNRKGWQDKPNQIQPYLPDETQNALYNAQKHILLDNDKPVNIVQYQGVGKESAGFTSLNILCKTESGLPCEIQIKGKHVNTVDEATKPLHDIDIAKKAIVQQSHSKNIAITAEDVIQHLPKFKALSALKQKQLKPVIETYLAISEKGYENLRKLYDKYVFDSYKAARDAEVLGHSTFEFPQLPNIFRNRIQMEKLLEIARELHLA
jgi:hypothetical protein